MEMELTCLYLMTYQYSIPCTGIDSGTVGMTPALTTTYTDGDDMEDLRKHLEIDKNALDQELERQAALFDRIADLVTEANKHRDTLKEKLATVDAELFREFRSTKDETKTRPTEASIKAMVQTDARHQQAFENLLKAKFDAE